MSILIDETTKVLVQGFTGDKATFHAKEMIAYGTQIVGGVTPGKGGGRHLDRPVFNTVKEAVRETGATASIIFVPAAFCADSIMEAADAGVRFVVTITDGIPAQDMMMVKRYLFRFPKERRTMLVGPNCAGVISPGRAMLGIMPGHIYIRVGRYMDAVKANEHAVHADETYIRDQRPGVSVYTAGYYPHNFDFLAFAVEPNRLLVPPIDRRPSCPPTCSALPA